VIYSFGSIIGQVEEGFHLIAPHGSLSRTPISASSARCSINFNPSVKKPRTFSCARA
jgi:hypothetical protein